VEDAIVNQQFGSAFEEAISAFNALTLREKQAFFVYANKKINAEYKAELLAVLKK